MPASGRTQRRYSPARSPLGRVRVRFVRPGRRAHGALQICKRLAPVTMKAAPGQAVFSRPAGRALHRHPLGVALEFANKRERRPRRLFESLRPSSVGRPEGRPGTTGNVTVFARGAIVTASGRLQPACLLIGVSLRVGRRARGWRGRACAAPGFAARGWRGMGQT